MEMFFLPETKMSLTKNIYSIYSFHGRIVIHEPVYCKNLSKAGFVSPMLALRQCRDWGAAISLIDQPLKRLRLIQSIRQITSTIKHRTDSVQNWQLWKISLKTVQEIYWERKHEILTPPSAHPAYGFGSLISGSILSIKERTFSGLDIKYPPLWYMSWAPIHLRWIKI